MAAAEAGSFPSRIDLCITQLEAQGPHLSSGDWVEFEPKEVLSRSYRGISLINNAQPPRITIGPQA